MPLCINLEGFLSSIKKSYDLDVEVKTTYQKRPIRLRGRAAADVSLQVFGPDREEYMFYIERHLEDFLEASGYVA